MPASFTQKSGDFRETESHIAYNIPKVHKSKQKHLQMTPLQILFMKSSPLEEKWWMLYN